MTSGLGLTGLFVAAVNFHHFGVVCEAVVGVVDGCHHGVLLLVVVGVVEGRHHGVLLLLVVGEVEGRHHGVLLLTVLVVVGLVGGVDVRKLNKYKSDDWSVLEDITVDLQ